MTDILYKIARAFDEVNFLLTQMLIPFSLKPVYSSRLDSELEQLINIDYSNYKIEMVNLIRLVGAFVRKEKPMLDSGFSKLVSKKINDTQEFYNNICKTTPMVL